LFFIIIIIIIIIFYKNRNTGFSSRHLLRLQKFCMNNNFATVFDDYRSCQKLINYTTNIKAKSKRYHWIKKIPVLKWLFIQNFCKRSRCREENPVFLFL
jgi:hypothetical protein